MIIDSKWLLPPTDLSLSEDEVHIWCACLNQFDNYVEKMAQSLPPDEMKRAERFRFLHHRNHFIVSHGLLRELLADYTKIEFDRIAFEYGVNGKPFLSEIHCGEKIRFNISHSNEYALFAFAYGREIGVDIEHICEIGNMDKLAEQVFSTNEIAVLQSFPNSERKKAFFKFWTRKEAYIKATGEGFSAELASIDISSNSLNSSVYVNTGNDSVDRNNWIVQDLNPFPGFAAAFAVEGDGVMCHRWRIPNDF